MSKAHTFKVFQSLTLADDFMFGEIMRQEKYSRPFLEALLGKKIAKIKTINTQQDFSDYYTAHGVRLDVYLEDENNTKYNIEMQTSTQRALERRIRYYQSAIDRHTLEVNKDYERLLDSFVIFICLDDYYRQGFAVYHRGSRVKEAPDIKYNDGTQAIILNADFSNGNAAPEILTFLEYLKDTYAGKRFDVSESEYLQNIETEIKVIKRDEGKEKMYMDYAMKMQDVHKEGFRLGREDGLAEGRAEGLAEGITKGLAKGIAQGLAKGTAEGDENRLMKSVENMLSEGLSPSDISRYLGIHIEETGRIISKLKENNP